MTTKKRLDKVSKENGGMGPWSNPGQYVAYEYYTFVKNNPPMSMSKGYSMSRGYLTGERNGRGGARTVLEVGIQIGALIVENGLVKALK